MIQNSLIRLLLLSTFLLSAPSCSLEEGAAVTDDGTANDDDDIAVPECGDRRIDAGEFCDGDIVPCDDGCYGGSRACLEDCSGYTACDIGSQQCGNGIAEGICEACDDANTQSGDGCSGDCRTDEVLLTCGNGQLDPGEACDGGTSDCDGACYGTVQRKCRADCRGWAACPMRCGNGSVEGCELCDDGNAVGGDGCSQDCQAIEVNGLCNNGMLDEGEICDSDQHGCGDGCYDGTQRCRTDCTGFSPCDLGSQGPANNQLEGCEACDDGNTTSGDGCSADGQTIEVIGNCNNGRLDSGELCDTSFQICELGCYLGLQTCRTDCHSYYDCPVQEQSCGDGIRQGCEACDDGNMVSGDGCRSNCEAFEQIGDCNNGRLDAGEVCDQSFLPCEADGYPGRELCKADCSGHDECNIGYQICGNGIIEGQEACDDANHQSGDGCSADCSEVEVVGTCNNGRPDPGEVCDRDSLPCEKDGYPGVSYCATNCTGFNDCNIGWQFCGNGLVEGAEVCDDGNNIPGDGCNADCSAREVIGTCNNGILDPGEVCDTTAEPCGDGCYEGLRHCRTDCLGFTGCALGIQRAGNGLVEGCEACDDSNTVSGDGCSEDGKTREVIGDCNNGRLDSGEICDTGSALCHDGCYYGIQRCQANCAEYMACDTLDQRPGDGIVQGCEVCDDGNTVDGDGCSADGRTLEVLVNCNNGVLDPGETCDTFALPCTDGCYEGLAHCRSDCRGYQDCAFEIQGPGNGLIEGCEACDDGNTEDGDGCGSDGSWEPNGDCHNNVLDSGETCDGGFTACGDCYPEGRHACSGDCLGYGSCSQIMGNGLLEGCEACDDGNTVDGDGCSADGGTLEISEPHNNGEVNPGEVCDSDTRLCLAGCYTGQQRCRPDGKGYYPCEPLGDAHCGDGYREGCEACDDGNNVDGDGCSADCLTREVIGDCNNGVVDDGEACDSDIAACEPGCYESGMRECRPDCTGYGPCLQRCGNGLEEGCEVCDDNNTVSNDGCNSNCSAVENVDGHNNGGLDPGEVCDSTSQSCTDGCYFGLRHCRTDGTGYGLCEIDGQGCGNGQREGCEACDDSNRLAGDGCAADCRDTELVGDCNNGLVNPPDEVCDSNTLPCSVACYNGAQRCLADCSDFEACVTNGSRCGNDIVEGCEACDDGNTVSGDGCSADCSARELIGNCNNGVVDAGEACDTDPIACGDLCYDGRQECEADCSGYKPCHMDYQACGNGLREGCEVCDDGNRKSGDGCNADCGGTVNPATCGDGRLDPGEICDGGTPAACLKDECYTGTQACLETCDGYEDCYAGSKRCGNGLMEDCEACDDGNNLNGDGCSADCATRELIGNCNNGVVDAGEACDSNSEDCILGSCSIGIGKRLCAADCSGFGECVPLFSTSGVCGNSLLEGCEACDDGNTNGNDGCSADCLTVLQDGICNDGTLQAGEVCDYFSPVNSQPCNNGCYSGIQWCDHCEGYGPCDIRPQACGNKILEGCEVCDGGGAVCTTFEGYAGIQLCNSSCSGYQGCQSEDFCGDGLVNGLEECDDGNDIDTDTCSNTCLGKFREKWSFQTGTCNICAFDPALNGGAGGYVITGGCVTPDDCPQDITGPLALSNNNGVLYLSASDGKVYAINNNSSSATLRWSKALGSEPLRSGVTVAPAGSTGTSGVSYADLIFAGSMQQDVLYALKADGSVLWSLAGSGLLASGPALDNTGKVYYATYWDGVPPSGPPVNPIPAEFNSRLYALSANGYGDKACTDPPACASGTDCNASPKPQCTPCIAACPSPPVQEFKSGGWARWISPAGVFVQSSPAVNATTGRVFVASIDGDLRAINISDGTEAWKVTLPKTGSPPAVAVISSPALDGSKLYIGTSAGNVHAINQASGSIAWTFDAEASVSSSPALGSGSLLFVGAQNGTVYAVDTTDGTKQWEFATEGPVRGSAAVSSSGRVYIGSDDGSLYSISTSTGSLLGRFPAGASVQTTPLIHNGFVFVAANNGRVFKLDASDGSAGLCGSACPWPRNGRDNQNTRRYP